MPELADELLTLPNLINIWSLVTFNTRLETLHVVLDPLLSFQSIKTIIVWFWTSSFPSVRSSMYARDFSFIIDGCLPDISTFIHVTQWHSLKTERFKLTSVGLMDIDWKYFLGKLRSRASRKPFCWKLLSFRKKLKVEMYFKFNAPVKRAVLNHEISLTSPHCQNINMTLRMNHKHLKLDCH